MALVNHETKNIHCKVFYFGASSSGKTENLRSVWSKTYSEARSGIVKLSEGTGPSKFFDFLPISLGFVRNYHIKVHLYTLPSPVIYKNLISTILKGIDGFIFVVDSQRDKFLDNLESLDQVKKILENENQIFAELPKVFQYNKQDLKDALKPHILRNEFNTLQCPDVVAVANQGVGTLESLELITKSLLRRMIEQP